MSCCHVKPRGPHKDAPWLDCDFESDRRFFWYNTPVFGQLCWSQLPQGEWLLDDAQNGGINSVGSTCLFLLCGCLSWWLYWGSVWEAREGNSWNSKSQNSRHYFLEKYVPGIELSPSHPLFPLILTHWGQDTVSCIYEAWWGGGGRVKEVKKLVQVCMTIHGRA